MSTRRAVYAADGTLVECETIVIREPSDIEAWAPDTLLLADRTLEIRCTARALRHLSLIASELADSLDTSD